MNGHRRTQATVQVGCEPKCRTGNPLKCGLGRMSTSTPSSGSDASSPVAHRYIPANHLLLVHCPPAGLSKASDPTRRPRILINVGRSSTAAPARQNGLETGRQPTSDRTVHHLRQPIWRFRSPQMEQGRWSSGHQKKLPLDRSSGASIYRPIFASLVSTGVSGHRGGWR